MKKEYKHPFIARLMHWTWVILMLILILTGVYIHEPSWMPIFPDFAFVWPMHIISGFLVLAITVARIFVSFLIGDFKDLNMEPKHVPQIIPVMKYYLFMQKDEPQQGKYNAGQRMLYGLGWPFLLVLMAVTGILLYFFPSVVVIRSIHWIGAWLLVVTALAHIYLGAIHGWKMVKSMITGWLEE